MKSKLWKEIIVAVLLISTIVSFSPIAYGQTTSVQQSTSDIVDIVITGVTDGSLYNSNVTPHFNIGTATLNGNLFTSGTQLTVEGSYTLTVTADSHSETIHFRIDKSPPTGKVIVNQGNQYTDSAYVFVSVTPDMGVNDITYLRYSVNGQPFTPVSYVSSFSLGIGTVNGENVLTFKLVDEAGNESPEYQSTIILDTVVPTGSVVINNGNSYTTNHEVTLNLSLGSDVTDVVRVRFSNNNSSWSIAEAFSPTKSYTLPAGDGDKTVYVRLIDRAGNMGIAQDSIILDTTAPIVDGVTNGGRYTSEQTITFNEGTAKLNGKSFISGSSVDAVGSYVLVVTDDLGNSITITFNIIQTYTVSYDGNGATGGHAPISSQVYETGNSVTVADNTGSLVKTGFTFNGWNTETDGGGTSYVANDTFNISTANVTLYAKWRVRPAPGPTPGPTPGPKPEPKPEPTPGPEDKPYKTIQKEGTFEVTKVWTVKLSVEVDASTLQDALFIVDAEGNRVQATFTSDGKNIFIAPPAGTYREGTYTLYITSKLKDKNGKTLKEPIKMIFTIKKINNPPILMEKADF